MDEKMVISTDTALDMLPLFADAMDKLGLKAYLADFKKSTDPTQAKAMGFDLLAFAIRGLPQAKNEIYKMLALATGTEADEIAKQPAARTIKQIKMIFTDAGLIDLFRSAI